MRLASRLKVWETAGREAWAALQRFPWRVTAQTLMERFREDRLGVTASSLTFTTTISLVPLFTVALAVFSAFPAFGRVEQAVQKWLVDSLVPGDIARQVLRYLSQFSAKATQIGWTGAVVLLVTAMALILTMDRKLNDIWRVRQPRSLTQRVLVYWALLTLGPVLLGASLSLTSYAVTASRGWAGAWVGGFNGVVDAMQFALAACGMGLVFRYVPNTQVRWTHALLGGAFVALCLEVARKLLALYLKAVPSYSAVYGAFATVPILLVWIYVAWVIVLLGAVVAAYLPSLMGGGIARRGGGPGWDFQLALEVAQALREAGDTRERGLGLDALSRLLRVDALQLEAPLGTLVALDWIGRLSEDEARYVLLVDPDTVVLGPLAQRLLLPEESGTSGVWHASGWAHMPLAQALPAGSTRV